MRPTAWSRPTPEACGAVSIWRPASSPVHRCSSWTSPPLDSIPRAGNACGESSVGWWLRSDCPSHHSVPRRGRRLADRIVVMDHGRVIAEGTPAELKASTGSQLLEVTLAAAPPACHRGLGGSASVRSPCPTAAGAAGAGSQRGRPGRERLRALDRRRACRWRTSRCTTLAGRRVRTPDGRARLRRGRKEVGVMSGSERPARACRAGDRAGPLAVLAGGRVGAHPPQPDPYPTGAAAALGRDHPAGAVHSALRLRFRLGHGRGRRRQLQAVRSRRPADHEPHDLHGGHRHRAQHGSEHRRDRPPAHTADGADAPSWSAARSRICWRRYFAAPSWRSPGWPSAGGRTPAWVGACRLRHRACCSATP